MIAGLGLRRAEQAEYLSIFHKFNGDPGKIILSDPDFFVLQIQSDVL